MSKGSPYDEMAKVMNKLPEVRWDRCTRSMTILSAFGWIARDDGRSDFLTLHYYVGNGFGFSTSSAALGREFSKRLFGTDEDYRDCERVEDVFGGRVKNVVTLKENNDDI